MYVVLIVLSVALAVILVATGVATLTKNAKLTESLDAVGFPVHLAPLLAAAELAGAAGLLVGLWWRPIGIAAAVGVTAYFLAAIGAHLIARDKNFVPAAALGVLGAVTLALHVTA